MNDETEKQMKGIDIKSTNLNELCLLMSCRLLNMTKHSYQFVTEQKKQIEKMVLSKEAKEACLEALGSIELEEVVVK